MRIQLISGAAALAVLATMADAAPTSMVQARQQPGTTVGTPESGSGGMGWLTKWWRKPTNNPGPVVVEQVAPPSYQAPTQHHATVHQHTSGYPVAGQPVAGQPVIAQPVVRQPVVGGSVGSMSPMAARGMPTNSGLPMLPAAVAAPTSVDDTITQAQAAEGRGQIDEARRLLAACAAANPTTGLVRRRLGHLEDRAGRLSEAEVQYRQAIACDPTSAAAINDLGLCLARQGRFDQSLATFQQAIMMRPDKPLYRNNIATVFVQLGRFDEALENLSGAYGPAVARYNLGQLMLKADRTAEAAEQFQQALAIDATMLPARSALERLGVPKSPTLAVAPAMTPAEPAYEAPTEGWPSQPVTDPRLAAAPMAAPASVAPAADGEFPRLLPPVIER
ncbi:MAG: tetratricopeptide repeat protein [Planctomycetota bacterium]